MCDFLFCFVVYGDDDDVWCCVWSVFVCVCDEGVCERFLCVCFVMFCECVFELFVDVCVCEIVFVVFEFEWGCLCGYCGVVELC